MDIESILCNALASHYGSFLFHFLLSTLLNPVGEGLRPSRQILPSIIQDQRVQIHKYRRNVPSLTLPVLLYSPTPQLLVDHRHINFQLTGLLEVHDQGEMVSLHQVLLQVEQHQVIASGLERHLLACRQVYAVDRSHYHRI